MTSPHAPIARQIRVLHVEDDPVDVELISSHLTDAGLDIEWSHVDDEPALRRALALAPPDLVLSDLSMPGFSGYRALALVREHSPYTPFIFVSGTMGEETAVDALRLGATDYVLKSSMVRLPIAVQRALREADERELRDRTEAELMRSQRLDSLAMLAGGLSHDLRNILQPLLMVAPMISERTEDERLLRLGELVEDCARRGLDMVASMLSFARGARQAGTAVNLKQLLRAIDLLLRGTLPRNIVLDMSDVPNDLAVEGNDTELQQCLLNLCLNAIQAMPGGGTLTLRAERSMVEADSTRPAGEYLRIAISDTGMGMDDEVQRRLFTPFFTTKKEGTGLGLLSCKRIVENHRGLIRVTSAPGAGTTFEVLLPLETASRVARAQSPAVRNAHVLVVAESAGSLSLLGDGLALEGYKARVAQGGTAAIHFLEQETAPDLIVLDADMRLLSGVRTLLELQERKYAGPVLLLVDDSEDTQADQWPTDLQIRVLRKPVALPELLDAVSQLLQARETR